MVQGRTPEGMWEPRLCPSALTATALAMLSREDLALPPGARAGRGGKAGVRVRAPKVAVAGLVGSSNSSRPPTGKRPCSEPRDLAPRVCSQLNCVHSVQTAGMGQEGEDGRGGGIPGTWKWARRRPDTSRWVERAFGLKATNSETSLSKSKFYVITSCYPWIKGDRHSKVTGEWACDMESVWSLQ